MQKLYICSNEKSIAKSFVYTKTVLTDSLNQFNLFILTNNLGESCEFSSSEQLMHLLNKLPT